MGLLDHKKHLLVLFASPHAHGSTRMLLESFLDVFKEKKDWDIKEVDLYEQPPHPWPLRQKGGLPVRRPGRVRQGAAPLGPAGGGVPGIQLRVPRPHEGPAGPDPAVF